MEPQTLKERLARELKEELYIKFHLDNMAGISYEATGNIFWVSGDTKPHEEHLKALGFQWNGEADEWFYFDCELEEYLYAKELRELCKRVDQGKPRTVTIKLWDD